MKAGFSYHIAQMLLDRRKREPRNQMAILGDLCVKSNMPVSEVAEYFGVSRQAVYSWLYGTSQPEEVNAKKADKLIKKLQTKQARKAG